MSDDDVTIDPITAMPRSEQRTVMQSGAMRVERFHCRKCAMLWLDAYGFVMDPLTNEYVDKEWFAGIAGPVDHVNEVHVLLVPRPAGVPYVENGRSTS